MIVNMDVGWKQVPVDDVTPAARRQFADIKVSDDKLRALVSDTDRNYVYAVSSRKVCVYSTGHRKTLSISPVSQSILHTAPCYARGPVA